jgi:single-stranded DNA-binding protein
MESSFLVNFFAGAGYLVEDAQFFTTQTGRPKVTFRMMLPRHPQLPLKQPENADFYTVIALGDRFVPLLDHLCRGRPVVVFGYAQSRDVTVDERQCVVSEIGASAIYLIQDVEVRRVARETAQEAAQEAAQGAMEGGMQDAGLYASGD